MNAYLVRIPEERTAYLYEEPPEWWYPTGIFVAETPSQAKSDALKDWAQSLRGGVYDDDWPALRVRLLVRGIDRPRGEVKDGDEELWLRAHEVLDHNGAPCSCDESGSEFSTATSAPQGAA